MNAVTPATPSDSVLVSCSGMDIAMRHVELLTGSADTPVHVRCLHDKDRSAPVGMLFGSVSECWPDIEAAQRAGYGVFLAVNEGGNTDAEITRTRALFVDADGRPLPNEWNWHTEPSFIVRRDATHWHAYWLVGDLPVDQFKPCQQRLAAHYGTDRSVSNPSRIMRLAGTLHLKDPAAPKRITLEVLRDPAAPVRNAAELMAGVADIGDSEPSMVSAARGEPITPDMLRAMLAHIDPTFDGGSGTWVGIAKAVRYGQIPLTEAQDEEWWIDLVDAWCSGELWRGDQNFNVSTYRGRDEMLSRIGDRPRDNGPAIALGTIIKLAVAGGYRGPIDATSAAETFKEARKRYETGGSEQSGQNGSPKERKHPRLVLRDWRDWANENPPVDAVEKLLPEKGVTFVIGKPAAGKSFVALGLMFAVASGCPAFGMFNVNRTGPVVYYVGEGAKGLERQRIPALFIDSGIPNDGTLPIKTVKGVPMAALAGEADTTAEAVRDGLGNVQPRMIVIDTLARSMFGLDSNSQRDAGLFTAIAESLSERFDCAVLVLAHTGVSGDPRTLGSVAFDAAADRVWIARSPDHGHTVTLECIKDKDGPNEGDKIDLRSVPIAVPETPRGSLVLRATRVIPAREGGQHHAGPVGDAERDRVRDTLRAVKAVGQARSLGMADLSKLLAGDPKSHPTNNDWLTEARKWANFLNNHSRCRSKAKGAKDAPRLAGLYDEINWPLGADEGGNLERRFFLPEDPEL